MENLSPGEIALIVGGALLALCGAIKTIGDAVEKLNGVRKAAKEPTDNLTARVDAIEARLNKMDGKLNNDQEQLDEIHNGLRASFQAQLALLDHGIDGNNIKQMQDAKEALLQHIIDR